MTKYQNLSLSDLFSESIRLWNLAILFQTKEREHAASLNTDTFIPLDKPNVIALDKTKKAISLFSGAKQKAIQGALDVTNEYAKRRYGLLIGRRFHVEAPGWEPMDITIEMIKPAGSVRNPMIVCAGYLQDGKRKSVVLSKEVVITPILSNIIDINFQLKARSGAIPISIAAKSGN